MELVRGIMRCRRPSAGLSDDGAGEPLAIARSILRFAFGVNERIEVVEMIPYGSGYDAKRSRGSERIATVLDQFAAHGPCDGVRSPDARW